MEKENLKKLGHELIDSLSNVQTSIVIVSDGSKNSALIAGVGGDIINSLANAMAEKKYTFLVHPEATKAQVKEAVEKMFEGAKVAKVNTMNQDGKTKRRGMTYGKTAKTKKAIVQLTAESADIELFEGL